MHGPFKAACSFKYKGMSNIRMVSMRRIEMSMRLKIVFMVRNHLNINHHHHYHNHQHLGEWVHCSEMPGPLTAVCLFKYMEVFRHEGNDEDGDEYIVIIIIIIIIYINIFIISTCYSNHLAECIYNNVNFAGDKKLKSWGNTTFLIFKVIIITGCEIVFFSGWMMCVIYQ